MASREIEQQVEKKYSAKDKRKRAKMKVSGKKNLQLKGLISKPKSKS